MFWDWLLKYSSFLITGMISLAVGLLINWLTSRRSHLTYYTSHPQMVQTNVPPQPGQVPVPLTIGTFTLFLVNQGKAPAREVHVGHFFLPDCNVFPDIPREIVTTPGGGKAIRFPVIPPNALITISYLVIGQIPIQNIVSYVGSEDGYGQHIPVMLQRIWPVWFNWIVGVLLLGGLWVGVNAAWSLIKFLWTSYYLS